MKNIAEKNIKYQTKLPWIFNILPIVFIIMGLFGAVIFSFSNGMIKYLGLSLILLMIKGILKLLHNLTTKIYLTDNKMTISTGLISKNIVDITLDKSEGVWINQGILGKIFNYGCVSITTAGINISQFINNPMEFRNIINKIK